MFKSKDKANDKTSNNIKEKKAVKTADENTLRVLKEIIARTVFGSIEGDVIKFSNYDITVKAIVREPENIGRMFYTDMIFVVNHKFFDQPIEEIVPGVGIDRETALAAGAQIFVDSTLEAVFSAFDADDSAQIRTHIMGELHSFKRAASHETIFIGESEPNTIDMWQIVKEDIPYYMGTKKAYWLSLYTSSSNGKITAEAKLNNIVYQGLTQQLYKYAKGWKNKNGFHSERQFFLFIQDDATYMPCDVTREQVFELTFKGLELLKQVHDVKTRDMAVNTIKMLAKDKNLAWEMCTFLPEIYAQKLFKLKEPDNIVAVMGGKQIPLTKAQLRVYGYIDEAVAKYMFHIKPSKEDSMRIAALSSKMQSITEVMEKGDKVEDMILPPAVFMVSEDYVIR